MTPSGIGEAAALALAGAGAHVAIGARRGDKLKDLASRIEADGGTALVLELDVTDEDACASAVSATRQELGGLDILVNCTGMMLLGPDRRRGHRRLAPEHGH